MSKNINPRCPLADECERKKCEYVRHELDCIYYETNGIEDNTIPDQEEKRRSRDRQREEKFLMDAMRNEPAECEDLSAQVEPERTADTVALEIRTLQRQAQGVLLSYAIEIGRRLEEAKGMLPHGEWGDWLKRELDYSQSTAQNLMRVFREYGDDQMSLFGAAAKSQALGNLTYTKALKLLAIPDEVEREQFVETHDVDSMSTRELEKTIKELNETKKALAQAEDHEQLMAAELALKEENLQKKIKELENKTESQQAAVDTARKQRDKVAEELEKAREELNELRSKPIEAAVMDQEALDKIRAEAVEEASEKIAELQEQMSKIEKRKAEAEEQLKKVHADAQQEIDALRKEAAREKERAEKAEKTAKVAANRNMEQFSILFQQTQDNVNRMVESMAHESEENRQKMRNALSALASAIGQTAQQ